MSAGALSIGEVAERTGQTVVALRHWEAMGLLPPPPRVGGKRRYPDDVVTRVAMIALLRRAGFSLEEVRGLLSARTPERPPGPQWRELTARKEAELDALLASVTAARTLVGHLATCRCSTLQECLDGV